MSGRWTWLIRSQDWNMMTNQSWVWVRRLDNYHLMIIFHIIQNISYFLWKRWCTQKPHICYTFGQIGKSLWWNILISWEYDIMIMPPFWLLLWSSGVTRVLSSDISTITLKRLNHRKSPPSTCLPRHSSKNIALRAVNVMRKFLSKNIKHPLIRTKMCLPWQDCMML